MHRMIYSLNTRFRQWRGAALFASVCLGGMASLSGPASAQIEPPAGNALVLTLFADGVQIYQSAPDTAHPGAFVWQFIAPQADLFTDASGNSYFGSHFAGPTWKAEMDGSEVVGAVVDRRPSPHPDSIPELLLEARSHSGTGIFAEVSYIQRLDTVGGIASSILPTGLGQEFRSPYTATYRFFEAVPEPGMVAWWFSLFVAGGLLYRRKACIRRRTLSTQR